MKTLYNAAGEAKEMESVDAREHLETGRWFNEPPADAPADAPVDAPADAPVDAPVDAPADAPVDAPVDAPRRKIKVGMK